MKKLITFLKPYLIAALIFLIGYFFIKCTETVILLVSKDLMSFGVFARSLAYAMIAACFYSLLLFILYAVLQFIGKKFAVVICAIIFSVLLILEIGLTVYAFRAGALLGSELILRPLSETVQTIRASMNILIPIGGIILITASFILLALKLGKKTYSKTFILSFSLFILIGSSLMFILKKLPNAALKPVERNYVVDKSWYCISSSISLKDNADYLRSQRADALMFPVDENMLKSFIADYPNREIIDLEYPLERKSGNIPDVLSPYFKASDVLPNIVVLVVESLGREWSGPIENDISFTPFIDSLAKSGLYWENCFSTTTRSYGAVPAITASAPYGVKGFQFGIMPKHRSLISILNDNGYQTNAFYGGDFTFDCIYDYLVAENIDYMSGFMRDKKQYQAEGLTNWWGLYDHVFFRKSMDILNESDWKSPIFNLFITLTAHENLNLKDESMQKNYIRKTESILSQMSRQNQEKFQSNLSRIAAIVYTDDCLNRFFADYRKRDDFGNTIFIITGDHASGLNTKNNLSHFHVPLLIWSPLIETPTRFSAVATHNDITPSVLSLLQNKYALKMPETIHWVSDGLDVSTAFRTSEKMLILNYNREIREFLYQNYYYFTKSKWEDEGILIFDENIDVERLYNDDIKGEIAQKFNVFKYVNNYVYHNDRLLSAQLGERQPYLFIDEFRSDEKIVCITPNYKPSEKGFRTYELLPEIRIASDKNWEKLKVSIAADVYINDSLWQDEYMDLEFFCNGAGMLHPIYFKDKVVKYLSGEIIRADTWYKLSLSKEIIVKDAEDLKLAVSVSTVRYDNEWVANSKLTITNVAIKIEGLESAQQP